MVKKLILILVLLAGAGVIPVAAHAGDYIIPEGKLIRRSALVVDGETISYEMFKDGDIFFIRGQYRINVGHQRIEQERARKQKEKDEEEVIKAREEAGRGADPGENKRIAMYIAEAEEKMKNKIGEREGKKNIAKKQVEMENGGASDLEKQKRESMRFIFYSAYDPASHLYVFTASPNHANSLNPNDKSTNAMLEMLSRIVNNMLADLFPETLTGIEPTPTVNIYREGLTVADMSNWVLKNNKDVPLALDFYGSESALKKLNYDVDASLRAADQTLPLKYATGNFYGVSVNVLPPETGVKLNEVAQKGDSNADSVVLSVVAGTRGTNLSKNQRVQKIVSDLAAKKSGVRIIGGIFNRIFDASGTGSTSYYENINIHEMVLRIATGLKDTKIQAEIKRAVELPDYL